MPGANCVFPGCFVSRTPKYENISMFKLPNRSGEFYVKWKKEILNIITKYRVVDKCFKKQIESGNIHVCERHFSKEDIELTSKNKIKYDLKYGLKVTYNIKLNIKIVAMSHVLYLYDY